VAAVTSRQKSFGRKQYEAFPCSHIAANDEQTCAANDEQPSTAGIIDFTRSKLAPVADNTLLCATFQTLRHPFCGLIFYH